MEKYAKIDKFELLIEELVCNKFGIAEVFVKYYNSLNMNSDGLVLDIGCGVGPLSLFLAEKGFKVHAIDINKIAIDLCIDNTRKYNLENKVEVFLENFITKKFDRKYDYIITNPPIDIASNIVLDEKSIEKIKAGIISPKIFEIITNSFRDENNKDLITHIFERSEELLNKDGKIIVIFADICGHSYSYVNNLCNKYKLEQEFYRKVVIGSKSIGLPSEMGENIDAYILMLGR